MILSIEANAFDEYAEQIVNFFIIVITFVNARYFYVSGLPHIGQ